MTAMAPIESTSARNALLTASEFVSRYATVHAELDRGIVKEFPMPTPEHGYICMTISGLLWNRVRERDLGRVMTNDSWIQTRRSPDSVRGADVCYFSYERQPRGKLPRGLLTAVPELVVEVRSPSDRWADIFPKIGEYLAAGVIVVVVIDPITETVSVYSEVVCQEILHIDDTLTLPDVLPGFSVPVRFLFE